MQLGRSTTPVVLLFVFQSVEKVSGQKPAFMIAPMVSHRMCPVCPLPMSNQTPRRRGREHLWKNVTAVVDDGVGRRRKEVRDDVAALQEVDQLPQRRGRLPHVNHQGQVEGACRLLCAAEHLDVVGPHDVARQPRLHADDVVAMLRDRIPGGGDIGPRKIHRVATRQDAATSDVDEDAPLLRRRSRDGNDAAQCRRRLATRRRSTR